MLQLRCALACAFFAVALSVTGMASAQVVTFQTVFSGGELTIDDRQLFRTTLDGVLNSESPVPVLDEPATEAEIGGALMDCRGGDCAQSAGSSYSSSVGIACDINAEAAIFDMTVRVIRMSDGEVLHEEVADCTFCPVAEAVEEFRRAARTAIVAVRPFPAPSGVAAAAAEVTVTAPAETPAQMAPTTVPAETAETAPTTVPAITPGPHQLSISVQPADARIRVNGSVVGTGTATLNVSAQNLDVRITAGGHSEFRERVRIAADAEATNLRVHLAPLVTEVSGAAGPRRGGRAGGWVLTLLGLGAVAGGTVAILMDEEPTCSGDAPAEFCAEAYETTALGAGLIGGGALLTGAGLVIAFRRHGRADDSTSQADAGTVFGAAIDRGGAVLRMRTTF